LPTHAEAIGVVIEKLTSESHGVLSCLSEISAVGHRVVHGGPNFSESVVLDEEALNAIEACTPLGPLHIPANMMGINACMKAIPGVPQIAVFDTAFHHTLPDYAYIYPIPYKYYEQHDIRRYGFHGTSHRYVSAKAIEHLGGNPLGTKIITCHLGNGSSLAAIKDGKCIETTMGVTPLEGVPMGTRSGTVDPTLVSIISELNDGIPISKTMDILNKESGVLGISGVSSDFRDIEAAAGVDASAGLVLDETKVNKRAKLALDVFNYHVAKFIGSYIVVMGGVDAIVFTAGVGENSSYTRKGICSFLNGIGIHIDEEANLGRGEFIDITADGSKARVFVIPTDEELVIARDTATLIGK
jgi:acetate kinase